jgi:hypothetical protein
VVNSGADLGDLLAPSGTGLVEVGLDPLDLVARLRQGQVEEDVVIWFQDERGALRLVAVVRPAVGGLNVRWL